MSRGQLLKKLSKKLINITGNDLLDKKLQGRGSARIFNVLDEASQFVLDDLIDGKKLTITGIKEEDEEYLEDEFTPRFKAHVEEIKEERSEQGFTITKEEIRSIKDEVRELLGLTPHEELIPDRNLDLLYGDEQAEPKDRHVDDELQTDLILEHTLKLLKKIESERLAILRERGLESLYISFGFLEWKREDPINNKTRNFKSPLLLMKVRFEVEKKIRFKLVSDGDLEANADLLEALKNETGIEPPKLEDYLDPTGNKFDFDLREFHNAYEKYSKKYDGWKVRNRIAVGIFKTSGIHPSEIDPEGYDDESIDRTEKLLEGQGYSADPNGPREVDRKKDKELVPAFALPVDSSQHAALLEVAERNDMVIEGPPGTGKSHTIVNLIADAMRRGKSVLFLAQKIAALDVVHNRLRSSGDKFLGLDKKCLRLDSDFANRRFLYGKTGELRKKISQPKERCSGNLYDKCKTRDKYITELNDFAHLMIKEIHGETYQNIITTSKINEEFIGKEKKPKFKIRNDFNLKELDEDQQSIKVIEQILSELDKSSYSLIEFVRCRETDPFKIEEIINKSRTIVSEAKFYLESFHNETSESSKAKQKEIQIHVNARKTLDEILNKLISLNDHAPLVNESDIQNSLDFSVNSDKSVSDFDFNKAIKLNELAITKIKEIHKRRLQIEAQISGVEKEISSLKKSIPEYDLSVLKSDPLSDPNIDYPTETKFFDSSFLEQDIKQINQAIECKINVDNEESIIREKCYEIKTNKEIEKDYEILLEKKFSPISCYLPFSRASKARKRLVSLFKEKVSLKELRKTTDELSISLIKRESNLDKLNTWGLSYSNQKLNNAKNKLDVCLNRSKVISSLVHEQNETGCGDLKTADLDDRVEFFEKIEVELIAGRKTKEKLKYSFDIDLDELLEKQKALQKIHSILEDSVLILEELECDFQQKSLSSVTEFLDNLILSEVSLPKIFSINSNLYSIEKNKGVGEWIRSLILQELPLSDKYNAHLYRFITQKISAKDRKIFDYRTKHYNSLKKRFSKIEEETRDELALSLRTQMPKKANIPSRHAMRVNDRRGLSLLEHVAEKNARVTVRELCHRASDALLHYCNCFLMTPSSVANYLPKDVKFDLLVIDEASQMLPEQSVGSILRSKQVVVVGDPKQMPPFRGMIATLFDEEEIEENDGIDKQTSILDLAAQTFSEYRRLQYHYRSEDEKLIQFSNHEFYEGDLITIPNQHQNLELGVHHHNADGTYSPGKEGGSRNPNKKEAEELVNLILKESREHPNWSLGVAVINKQQALRVEEILEEKTLRDQKFKEFRARWNGGPEYFFIKNLENVQGDERDTVIISTVYGRDEHGKAHNRFGPINANKGENRINVLITRAKKRVVVCSSMYPNDITAQAKGAQCLRRYLQYSMTGKMDSVLTSNKSEKDHWYDAPWEKWFHDRLEADGYEVDPQVGVSNWRIDLGVKHKDYPAGYICGIELDGPDHLKLSARDRDIERQSILESKGWTIFRVWSMDFFSDMEGEYNIIKKAIKSTLKKKISEMKNLPNEVNQVSENPLRQDVESDGEKIEYLSTASASDILGM